MNKIFEHIPKKEKISDLNLTPYKAKKYSNDEIEKMFFENSSLYKNILHTLNGVQQKIVMHKDGPIIASSGPGSGKTRTIVYKIACLIQHYEVNPNDILCVTFTKKAANEIKNRLGVILNANDNDNDNNNDANDGNIGNIITGTFHSVCYQFLRISGFYNGYTIIDDNAQKRIIDDIITSMNKKEKDKNLVYNALHEISTAKNHLQNAFDYNKIADNNNIAKIYTEYENILRSKKFLDFDDLLVNMVNLIRSDNKFRKKVTNRFKYVLVDEFQDTNSLQFEISMCFAENNNNIIIVGDIDQSIYGWRFADYSNVEKFMKLYPNHTKYLLEQNYRSTKNIIEISNAIIEQEKYRLNNKIWTDNDDGDKINLRYDYDADTEAEYIAKQIVDLNNRNKHSFNEIAVLIRTHYQSRQLEDAFTKHGIPYEVVGDFKFYNREEIQDIIAYLKFVINKNDYISFERIANVPKRRISKKILTEMITVFKNNDWAEVVSMYEKKLKTFVNLINECDAMILNKNTPLEIVMYILRTTKYQDYLNTKYEDAKATDKWNNVCELTNAIEKYKTLESFLIDIQLTNDLTNDLNNNLINDRVIISTVHSAKGLEWDTVFIPSINENIMPHYNAIMSEDSDTKISEERRLLYVACTRARKKLFLSFCKIRKQWGKTEDATISRFIKNYRTTLSHIIKYTKNTHC